MDTSVLLPAGIAVLYALLILIVVKYHVRRSNAVHISPEMAEIHFALKEGHTIVGVMDNTRAMRFYIGTNVIEEKNYNGPPKS
jgi:hypothetical protein